MSRVKEISVFVDESGSFAPLSEDATSPYYLLCMVFHDQSVDIKGEIGNLEDSFQRMGLERDHCVHSGPLIRREQNYAHMSREERRGIFQHMLAFFRRTNISYRCFSVNKRTNSRRDAIHDTLLRQIVAFLIAHLDDSGKISMSENAFFGGAKALRKGYLKILSRKEHK